MNLRLIISFMNAPNILKSLSKKVLFIITAVIVLIGIAYFIWQKNKYRIVNTKLATTVTKKTDSLYIITYDSIHFDALTGQAYLQNIHVSTDSNVIKNRKLDSLPFIFLDIKIGAIKINGIKTDKALLSQQIVGDSVIIDNPVVTAYFVKPLEKKTKIDVEASTVYDEILGNLHLIKVGHVFINNLKINGVGFFLKEKYFEVTNSNIQLVDVLIDSAHNVDTSRTLFCKHITLQLDSFINYNNTRPAITVQNVSYSAPDNLLSFGDIAINRFETDNSDSIKLLHAIKLTLNGIDANEIVKNKNIIVDTIQCKGITFYQPPLENLKKKNSAKPATQDTTGFRNVYSIAMKYLAFPKITFVPQKSTGLKIGNIAITINNVKAVEIADIMSDPLEHGKEVEISCNKVSMNSKDGLYNYSFQNASINSLHKEFKIGTVIIKPYLSEKAFANKVHFQHDRYDIVLKGVALQNISMHNLLEKKLFASDLLINNTSAKIYRDLTKPDDGIPKIGNYPSQMLMKLKVPVNIQHGTLSNTFIQYTEHEKISDSSGVVTFNGSVLNLTNITNDHEALQKNSVTTVAFSTKALNVISLKGAFKFFMDSPKGDFGVNGNATEFAAPVLNKVAVPMALIELKEGTINSLDFNIKGDNSGTRGDFVMKYSDMKVTVLKIDKESKEVSKKRVVSLLANVIVKNNNPQNGNLRKETPSFKRGNQKSFFNLIWKTIFTGMKKTVGIP